MSRLNFPEFKYFQIAKGLPIEIFIEKVNDDLHILRNSDSESDQWLFENIITYSREHLINSGIKNVEILIPL